MEKSGNRSGLFQFIDRKKFDALVDKWEVDKGVRTLTTWELTCSLVNCMIMRLTSYREAEAVLGIPRSTFGDALNERSYGFFQELCDQILLAIKAESADRRIRKAIRKILAIDSSECRVHGSLFSLPGWKQRSAKDEHLASIKLHVVWNVNDEWIEEFLMAPNQRNDTPVGRGFKIESNKIYVFDRAYNDVVFWMKIVDSNSHFVTRLKVNHLPREKRKPVLPEKDGVLFDEYYSPSSVTLARFLEEKRPSIRFRHIVYRDPETKKVFHFATSDFTSPAEKIAEIYKQRWAIELLFRWLKGHLNIRYLPVKSPNAAKVQLATAVLVQLLLQLKKLTDRYQGTLWELLRQLRTDLCRMGLAGSHSPPDCRWKWLYKAHLKRQAT